MHAGCERKVNKINGSGEAATLRPAPLDPFCGTLSLCARTQGSLFELPEDAVHAASCPIEHIHSLFAPVLLMPQPMKKLEQSEGSLLKDYELMAAASEGLGANL